MALTGQAQVGAFKLEPSASAYILNEQQEAYTDSLGTLQAERKFNAGRASAGGKAIYPMQWRSAALEPYVGLYGDYYFSGDTALVTGVASQAVITGWSGRVVAGLGTAIDGKRMLLESELGGLGSAYLAWTLRGRLSVPLH